MPTFLPRLPLLSIQLVLAFCEGHDLARLVIAAGHLDHDVKNLVDRQWLQVFELFFGLKLTRQGCSPPSGQVLQKVFPLLAAIPRSLVSHENPLPDGLSILKRTVIFRGLVEGLNFCVQSDVPFPSTVTGSTRSVSHLPRKKPRRSSLQMTPGEFVQSARKAMSQAHRALASMFSASTLGCSGGLLNHSKRSSTTVSFVSPFLTQSGQWCLLPRSISYYEVTIEAAPASVASTNSQFVTQAALLVECVAVGLATEGFSNAEMLPGWDLSSFGYHGDDGAIFHGRGRALKSYGPSFSVGDTVGCGLDLRRREIFFTHNGKHLGAAFINVDPSLVLYPTVGIDANATVTFNFGQNMPFKFCLEGLML